MKSNTTIQTKVSFSENIRHRFANHMLSEEGGVVRIVAASAQSWVELASLDTSEIACGEDGLFRVALWSASNVCAALMGTRHATLICPEGTSMWEIRCLVSANASLRTSRPLSGFLLRPVEVRDRRADRGHFSHASLAPDAIQSRADETRLALFTAFPVANDGDPAPPAGESSA